MQAYNYHIAAESIARALTTIAKRSEKFDDPKTTTEHLAYAAVATVKALFNNKHLDGLAFIDMSFNLDGQDTKKGVLWEEFQSIHNINYDSNIKPKLNAS